MSKMRDRGWLEAVKAAGGINKLAHTLGITHVSVIGWDKVPIDRVFAIEEKFGIPRERLRPDIFNVPRPQGRRSQVEKHAK